MSRNNDQNSKYRITSMWNYKVRNRSTTVVNTIYNMLTKSHWHNKVTHNFNYNNNRRYNQMTS